MNRVYLYNLKSVENYAQILSEHARYTYPRVVCCAAALWPLGKKAKKGKMKKKQRQECERTTSSVHVNLWIKTFSWLFSHSKTRFQFSSFYYYSLQTTIAAPLSRSAWWNTHLKEKTPLRSLILNQKFFLQLLIVIALSNGSNWLNNRC